MVRTLLHSKTSVSRQYLNRHQAIKEMNHYGETGTPFLFLISYDTNRTVLIENPLVSKSSGVLFAFPEYRNDHQISISDTSSTLYYDLPSLKDYARQFRQIQHELHQGNIYLLNLTHPTAVQSHSGLTEIYSQARAKYKICVPDHFVVFSPETFIRIIDGKIYTYPMKGTIRADHPKALETLRDNPKERAEHASVVDLLRNDLGQVAHSIQVSRFRYFEKVLSMHHELWQTSSEIEGTLPSHYAGSLGDIVFSMLPAGSITGVPKRKAVQIIQKVEKYDRGFYTGICGYFDGKNLDSGVMIRFIEQTANGLVYKSGGGIHQMSEMESEYQELIQKIYVPVD